MTQKDDLISRQDAINTVHKIISGFFSEKDGAMTDTEKTLLSVNKAVRNGVRELPSAQPEPESVGCSGCRYERYGNRVCDVCSRFYVDRYEAERRTDGWLN